MKGLFTRGRENDLKSYDIENFYGVKGDVPKSRAYLIRKDLQKVKRSWGNEYEKTIIDLSVDDDWVGDGVYGRGNNRGKLLLECIHEMDI